MNFTEHTKIRKEKFGTVIFDTLTEKIFVTDRIGAEILSLIEKGMDLPKIISELKGSFDGEGQIIAEDILEFTNELKLNNIINA